MVNGQLKYYTAMINNDIDNMFLGRGDNHWNDADVDNYLDNINDVIVGNDYDGVDDDVDWQI